MPRLTPEHDCPTCGQPWPKRQASERVVCDKCGKSLLSRGFTTHYAACPYPVTLDKLWAAGQVDTSQPDACWLWATEPEKRYPTFATKRVIRWVLELRHGEDGMAGLISRHTCDNPYCVNPTHLLRGTPAQNLADAYERNRIDVPARNAAIKAAHLAKAAVPCKYDCGRMIKGEAQLRRHEAVCGDEPRTGPNAGKKQTPEHVAKRLASRKEKHGY